MSAPRITPATARLDAKPRNPTKAQRLRQHRQAEAWQRKAKRCHGPQVATPSIIAAIASTAIHSCAAKGFAHGDHPEVPLILNLANTITAKARREGVLQSLANPKNGTFGNRRNFSHNEMKGTVFQRLSRSNPRQ
jgi:hypothetical protein